MSKTAVPEPKSRSSLLPRGVEGLEPVLVGDAHEHGEDVEAGLEEDGVVELEEGGLGVVQPAEVDEGADRVGLREVLVGQRLEGRRKKATLFGSSSVPMFTISHSVLSPNLLSSTVQPSGKVSLPSKSSKYSTSGSAARTREA